MSSSTLRSPNIGLDDERYSENVPRIAKMAMA